MGRIITSLGNYGMSTVTAHPWWVWRRSELEGGQPFSQGSGVWLQVSTSINNSFSPRSNLILVELIKLVFPLLDKLFFQQRVWFCFLGGAQTQRALPSVHPAEAAAGVISSTSEASGETHRRAHSRTSGPAACICALIRILISVLAASH